MRSRVTVTSREPRGVQRDIQSRSRLSKGENVTTNGMERKSPTARHVHVGEYPTIFRAHVDRAFAPRTAQAVQKRIVAIDRPRSLGLSPVHREKPRIPTILIVFDFFSPVIKHWKT